MKCDRCGIEMAEDEGLEHLGQKLCEDCYLDARNPAKGCDPWAVKLATSEKGSSGKIELTNIQQAILDELNKDEFVRPEDMASRLNLSKKQLEREVATLRHMEIVRGEKRDEVVYLTKF